MTKSRLNMKQETNGLPAISVIVPIYNAEKTIRKCVDSLLAQTFQDFEILLIDDGSPDQCGAICDEYAKQDTRIRVIHQENQGVSAARQCGIDHAQGEYTIHADPDDWVEPEMLEELYKKAKEDDADMVICDFYENTYKGQRYIKQQPTSLDSEVVLKELFDNLHGSTWNKLIRVNCFKKCNVQFPKTISFCEDLYVNAALLLNDITVSYLNYAYYHYVKNNPESLSRRYNESSERTNVKLLCLFTELFKESEACNMINDHFTYLIVSKAFWGGKDFYTSKQFKVKFGDYIESVKKMSHNRKEKVLLILSCYGLYHPLIYLVEFGMRIKYFAVNLFSWQHRKHVF